jgi:Tfp pilus assembly protein PilF
MSLISDALKTAQRERSGRTQSPNSSQPLVEGFFPYVASEKSGARSRRAPIIAVSAGAIALLSIVAWLMLSKPDKAPAPRGAIVLPPPVTVAQSPIVTDTAATVADTQPAAVVPDRSVNPAPETTALRRAPVRQATGSAMPTATVPETPARSEPVSAGDAPLRAPVPRVESAPRVDYEAEATALFNAGDLAAARDRFQLATRYAPTARAWTNYGVTLQRLGDYAGAAAAYQSAVGIDANYLEAWLYQGRLSVQQGDAAKAVPLFQRARAINPRNADVNVELARLEYEARNWTETRRFAEDAVRGDPANARGYWYVAVSSDQLKDVDAAVRAYSSYLQTVGSAEREQAQFVGWARTRLAELRGKP